MVDPCLGPTVPLRTCARDIVTLLLFAHRGAAVQHTYTVRQLFGVGGASGL